MKASTICEKYFQGFFEISNYKNDDYKTITLTVLKILSYFTVIIPVCVCTVYGAIRLYEINNSIARLHQAITTPPEDGICVD